MFVLRLGDEIGERKLRGTGEFSKRFIRFHVVGIATPCFAH